MKKILLFLLLATFGIAAKAQFPTKDSLNAYINKYITNSAFTAFTNLRLNTALQGLLQYIDTARSGAIDTAFKINDSTLRIITQLPDTFDVQVGSGAGSVTLDSARTASYMMIINGADTTKLAVADRSLAGAEPPEHYSIIEDSVLTQDIQINDSVSCRFRKDGTLVRCDTVRALQIGWGVETINSGLGFQVDSNDIKALDGWGGGGGTPGGSTTQVQFNSSGSFAGDAGMTYNSSTNVLNVDSIALANNINLNRLIRNMNGGVNQDSIGFGACVIRGNASGGAGSTITWYFIDDTDHGKRYFTNIYGNSTGNTIHLSYPEVGRILSLVAVPDETLSQKMLFIGASVGDTSSEIYLYQQITSSGLLTGNGTNFTASGDLNSWTINFNSGTGLISATPPSSIVYSTSGDPNHIAATYAGTNNYRLVRVTSGLGADIVGWKMYDIMTNTVVTGVPSSADIIQFTGLPKYRQINCYQVGGTNFESNILTANSNIWIFFSYLK